MVKPQNSSQDGSTPESQNAVDRRKHLRVRVPLKARYLNAKGEEERCLVVDVSAGGALFKAKNPPAMGAAVVIYIDELGRFEGKVVRSGPKSFAIAYEKTRPKSARTADNLTQILNRGRRVHERRKDARQQLDGPAMVYFEDGRAQECAILDISLTGASIEINPRPPLGAGLVLGRMTAKVVRRHDKGVGVVFTGSAQAMDEVIDQAAKPDNSPSLGAPVARRFGKKSDQI